MSPRLFVDIMFAFRFAPPPLVRPKWMLPLPLCRNCTASGFCTSQIKLCLLFGPRLWICMQFYRYMLSVRTHMFDPGCAEGICFFGLALPGGIGLEPRTGSMMRIETTRALLEFHMSLTSHRVNQLLSSRLCSFVSLRPSNDRPPRLS